MAARREPKRTRAQRQVDTDSDTEEDVWIPPALEQRPQKRTRVTERDADTESDSADYLEHYLNDSDPEDNLNNYERIETVTPRWQRHEIIGSEEIETLECIAQSQD